MASILPKTVSELDGVIRRSRVTDLSEALAKEVSVKKRSVEWLVENGRCVDNIRPGRSNLPFAGRGAIAQRFIGRGEIVVPVPLIQIMNTDLLTLWKKVQNDKGDWDKVPVGKQLLLNYCFGHDESSLLLCPITNAILINHCSNRTKECGKDGPNAEFRWDTEFDKDTKRWLEMTLEEMEEVSYCPTTLSGTTFDCSNITSLHSFVHRKKAEGFHSKLLPLETFSLGRR